MPLIEIAIKSTSHVAILTRNCDRILPPVYPHRYKLLVVQAFVDDKISEGQLSKLLRCSRIQAREIVDQYSETADDGEGTQSRVTTALLPYQGDYPLTNQ